MKEKVKSLALRLGETLLFAAASTAVVSLVNHKLSKILKDKKEDSDKSE